MPVGTLYYSKKCQYCDNLINLLKSYELNTLLRYECVDCMRIDEIEKLCIETVPAIKLFESNDKLIYSGVDAFVWASNCINKMKLSKI